MNTNRGHVRDALYAMCEKLHDLANRLSVEGDTPLTKEEKDFIRIAMVPELETWFTEVRFMYLAGETNTDRILSGVSEFLNTYLFLE